MRRSHLGAQVTFSPLERAVLAYTDDLVLAGGRVPDATMAALKAELSDEAILSSRTLLVPMKMHATMCRALRLEYDDVDERLVEVPVPSGEKRDIDFMKAVDKPKLIERLVPVIAGITQAVGLCRFGGACKPVRHWRPTGFGE